MDRIDTLIADTISRWEGGYVNHPADHGGPTHFGITQRTLAAFRGRPVTAEDVRTLPRAEAVTIYRQRYWQTTGVDRLPEPLQPVVFDSAVNLGPGAAVRLLQQALGDLGAPVAVDGVLGAVTAATAARLVAERGAGPVINAVCDRRQRHYDALVAADPTHACFRAGWRRRCDGFRRPA